MSDESFSLDEIRAQLASLGYTGLSEHRMIQFQSDLSRLMNTCETGDDSFDATLSSKTPDEKDHFERVSSK